MDTSVVLAFFNLWIRKHHVLTLAHHLLPYLQHQTPWRARCRRASHASGPCDGHLCGVRLHVDFSDVKGSSPGTAESVAASGDATSPCLTGEPEFPSVHHQAFDVVHPLT